MRRAFCTFTIAAVAFAIVTASPSTQQTVANRTAATAPAGAVDSALFSGLRWRSIGPARGGRSIAVAGSSSRPYEY